MKKWLLILSVVVGILIPTSAFAASPTYPDVMSVVNGKPYIVANDNSGRTWLVVLPSNYSGKIFVDSTNYLSQDGGNKWSLYHPSGSSWVSDGSNMSYGSFFTITDKNSIFVSTMSIYNSDKSTVFFRPTPGLEVATIAGVDQLPTAVLHPIQDGGLLLVGLAILAIMLVVSLVPRLRFWFLH